MAESLQKTDNRLASLDILRGFDMFWITGGGALVAALFAYLGWPSLEPIKAQMEHVEWEGFRAWDLIFPLFIFISGCAMPFSFEKYLAAGKRKSLYIKVIKRAIVLVLLGLIYNGMLKKLDFENLRFLSVLGLIGMAYLWASMVVIHCRPLKQLYWAIGILVGYWLIMILVPVPGHGAGVLTLEGNFASYVDRLVVPGKLLSDVSDPEGIIMSIPASVLAILGALAGALLKNQSVNKYKKCLLIAAAGVCCLLVGFLWGQYFPMIKKLWTSSFVVYAAGWAMLLLSLFYLVVDVWGIRRIFFPFMLIGLNPITIYFAARVIDFYKMSDFFLGGLARISGPALSPVIIAGGVFLFQLAFLYVLYRKKIFLRI